MAITGVANLAVKVRDIEDAVAFSRRAGAGVTHDLDRHLAGHEVVWGPCRTSGPTFGTRRIAFVDAPGQMRLEFMEQLENPL